MRSAQHLLCLEETILLDCCDLRRRQLELEGKWKIEEVKVLERVAQRFRHCGMGCLKGKANGRD